MSTLTSATSGAVWEDGGATLMARIVGGDAVNILQADLTAIAYKVFDLTSATPDTATDSGACAVATHIWDALQTDDRWSADSTGYNFRDVIPAATLATGNHRYRVEYEFDPVAGENFWVVFELQVQPVRSS